MRALDREQLAAAEGNIMRDRAPVEPVRAPRGTALALLPGQGRFRSLKEKTMKAPYPRPEVHVRIGALSGSYSMQELEAATEQMEIESAAANAGRIDVAAIYRKWNRPRLANRK